MFNKRVKSWMGFLGVFGFLGVLGFILNEPGFLIFFVFFGFLGFYWEGKMNHEKIDERLKINFSKAQRYGYRVGMSMIFLTVLLSERFTGNYKMILMVQTTLICLGIAVTLILVPMLTYYFDKTTFTDKE